MAISAQNLDVRLKHLAERFQWLHEVREGIVDRANPFIRGVSDWISGGDHFYDNYNQAYQNSWDSLWKANQAFQKGQAGQAARFLSEAERFLDRAQLFWDGYRRATTDGAFYAIQTLTPIRNGATAFGVAGVTALTLGAGTPIALALVSSVGLHAAGLSLLIEEESQPIPPSPEEKIPAVKTKEEAKPKLTTTSDKGETGVVWESVCPVPAEEKTIPLRQLLRAIDEPQPSENLRVAIQIAIQQTAEMKPPTPPPPREDPLKKIRALIKEDIKIPLKSY